MTWQLYPNEHFPFFLCQKRHVSGFFSFLKSRPAMFSLVMDPDYAMSIIGPQPFSVCQTDRWLQSKLILIGGRRQDLVWR